MLRIFYQKDKIKSTTMKSYLVGTIVLLLLGYFSGTGQNWEIQWENKLGSSKMDMFKTVIEVENGEFVVLGSTCPEGRSDSDFWLMRFDSAGKLLWERTMGTEHNDIPESLARFSDGGFILAGKNYTDKDNTQAFLLKTDSTGTEVWQKMLTDTNCKSADNVIVLEDDCIVVSGIIEPNGNDKNIWLAKFSDEGELIWEKTFGEKSDAGPGSLKVLPDGSIALAGQVSQPGRADSDLWIFRFNNEGEKIWDTQVKTPGIKVWPECICCSPDSNLVAVGWYGTCMNDINSAEPIFDFDLFVTKMTPAGKVLYTRNIDSEGSEGGNAVVIRPDGKILLAGIKETSFLGRIGPWLLLTDEQGKVLSELVLPFTFRGDQASGIINTSDGGFVVVGPGLINPEITRSDGWIKKFKAF